MEEIYNVLLKQEIPIHVLEIQSQLSHLSSDEIYEILYNNTNVFKKTNMNNMICWSVDKKPKALIFVDLGNVHDVLQHYIGPFSVMPEHIEHVYAYADYSFNGFGLREQHPRYSVHVDQSRMKNGADVQMIWDLSRLTQQLKEPINIYIVSKDNGWQTVKHIIERECKELCAVTFVTNWESLNKFI